MNLTLTADLEKRVSESVARGDFASRDEFFREAAELLLDLHRDCGSPVAVDEHWENHVEAFIEEAQASGEATEMKSQDWEEVERQGLALIKARKKA